VTRAKLGGRREGGVRAGANDGRVLITIRSTRRCKKKEEREGGGRGEDASHLGGWLHGSNWGFGEPNRQTVISSVQMKLSVKIITWELVEGGGDKTQ